MIKKLDKYSYGKFEQINDHGPRTYDVNGNKLPSVTTVLGETKCWEVKSENFRLTGPKKGNRISRGRRNIKFTKIIHMIYVDKDGTIREGTRK